MSKPLFSEFEAVSSKKWKQSIQAELKGADYNDTLIWQSLEGIHVKPFYHADEADIAYPPSNDLPQKWHIVQRVFVDDVSIANKLAKDALERGAEALCFVVNNTFSAAQLFKGIEKGVTVYWDFQMLDLDFMKSLRVFASNHEFQMYFRLDLIHHLAKEGNWYLDMKKDHDVLDILLKEDNQDALLGVDLSLYQNAGANMVQQLAYGLSHLNEYLNYFKDTLGKNSTITCTLAVGSNYFFEIAKLRAFRWLFNTLCEAHGIDVSCHILAQPSNRNKTIYDYNVNMLRTTTEVMSAVLGGADGICSAPYDVNFHKSNEFGERISRNQLLLLKAESYFDVVENPADGSYYIENLTHSLAEKALALFKEIEKAGGLLKELKSDTIQRKIEESANKEQKLFDEGKLVLIGTNKYPNKLDRMSEDLELYPFLKRNPRKTIIQPILERRLAESIEKERLQHEKN